MGKIKIAFSDFWKGFEAQDNWFFRFLSAHFEIELSDTPDFLIYSCSSHKHLDFDGIKIFYTPENVRPNFWECDYALGFDFLDRPNYLRLPLYVIWDGLEPKWLIKQQSFTHVDMAEKTKFCSLIISNGKAKERIEFFKQLSAYMHVDSGGKFLNNIGGPVEHKMEFLRPYKFNIAFENSSYPGYVTEKIYQPMFTNTIPIYWGSPRIAEDFNPKSFINCHDFSSWAQVIERELELHQDEEKYLKMLNEPWLYQNKLNNWMQETRLVDFFRMIFQTTKKPVSKSWKKPIGIIERKRQSLLKKLRPKFR
jgi:hypothetical protein